MPTTRILTSLLFLLVGTACVAPGAQADPADVVYTNARFVTVDEDLPEARALAVRDGRIHALGSVEAMAAHIGPGTEVVDLDGAFVMPGFIEGHGHFLGMGDAMLQLDLLRTESWDEIVRKVADAVALAEPGEVIRGRGWHQEKWTATPVPDVHGLPVHEGLSAVSPDNPVVLRHASGHASFANAKAMELAGIDLTTPDPEGGEIVRGREGHAIGMFTETAQALLGPAEDGATRPSMERLARLADAECRENGITSFQDAGSSVAVVEALRALVDEGALDVRLWVMIRDSHARMEGRLDELRVVGHGDDQFTVRGIKHSIDGALGPHGAWLLEPYADLPESTGYNTTPVETIETSARLALEHDYQLCVHAIGDRANRETLDLFERAFGTLDDGRSGADLRWRVEHAQHLALEEIPRFVELGAIASMQGVHCTSDGPWVEPRLGERRAREGAYVWKSLIDSGAVVTNGTDAPVEDVDPIASFYASVSRRMADGTPFYPDERMTRMQALHSYTLANAYAAFEEDIKGSLTPGKLADMTVLSQDLLECPEDQILDTKVLYTIIGGEIVYARDS